MILSQDCNLDEFFMIVAEGLKINIGIGCDITNLILKIFERTEILHAILYYIRRDVVNIKTMSAINYIVTAYIIKMAPR